MTKVPSASTLTLSGQSDWKLFDEEFSIFDSGEADAVTRQAPAGAYVAVFGPAGSTASVVLN